MTARIRDQRNADRLPGTQLALSDGVKCIVVHLDGKEREATHRAWTRLEPEHVEDVCESCARALVALGWLAEAMTDAAYLRREPGRKGGGA